MQIFWASWGFRWRWPRGRRPKCRCCLLLLYWCSGCDQRACPHSRYSNWTVVPASASICKHSSSSSSSSSSLPASLTQYSLDATSPRMWKALREYSRTTPLQPKHLMIADVKGKFVCNLKHRELWRVYDIWSSISPIHSSQMDIAALGEIPRDVNMTAFKFVTTLGVGSFHVCKLTLKYFGIVKWCLTAKDLVNFDREGRFPSTCVVAPGLIQSWRHK